MRVFRWGERGGVQFMVLHVCIHNSYIQHVQVRDLLFSFLKPKEPNSQNPNPETLPVVPVAACIVLGGTTNPRSVTTPPFPLGTRVTKVFAGVPYDGEVTEHRGTLVGGDPQYYHIVYADGDEEDVDATECVNMTELYNDRIVLHVNMGCLLNKIFVSAVPAPKTTVFTRAEDVFGSQGPDVGHPFAGKYDIVQATFKEAVNQRFVFVISDPQDDEVTTSATLNDKDMRDQLQSGDRLRLEVVSASLGHAFLRVPTCVGFLTADRNDEQTLLNMLCRKPLAVINIAVLGFFHKDTKKFVRRPFATDFVQVALAHRVGLDVRLGCIQPLDK